MGYSREIYDEIQKKLYKIRNDAWDELARKKEFFYKRFPEAANIERKMLSTSVEVARAVLSGSNSSKELAKLREKNKLLRQRLSNILKSVNLPENYLEIKYNCQECEDEGFVDGIMCKCMKNMLKMEAYNKLNEFSPLENSSFDNFSLDYYSETPIHDGEQSPRERMKLVFNRCKKYVKEFRKNSPGLLMKGNTGLGKTHLSLAIARELINKGFSVIYTSAQNMILNMEKERFRGYAISNENEKHYSDCDLLIIDDLGTEYITNFSSAAIYNVINSRIMRDKPTIINTNLPMRKLEECYTERMASRIIGNNIRLEFLGSDVRQKRKRIQNK